VFPQAVTNVPETSTGILGGLAEVGRYFRLISILPATVVVASVSILIVGGAPGQAPSWTAMARGVADLGLGEAAALAFAVLIVGMIIHPLQFAATQFLEGYWGPSSVGRTAMLSKSIIHFLRRSSYLKSLNAAQTDLAKHLATLNKSMRIKDIEPMQILAMRANLDSVAFDTGASRYPENPYDVMPTRLGNMLRRYEHLAGQAYGHEAVETTTHLMYMAPPEHRAYVNDARTELDLAVRFVISWLLVAATTFILVWPYGGWIAVPIVAYLLAWTSYRSAVHAAEAYGAQLAVLFDLNHHLLDERLKRQMPSLISRWRRILRRQVG
jgi:hypothetical protein